MDRRRRVGPRVQAWAGSGRISERAHSARRAGGAKVLTGCKTDHQEKSGVLEEGSRGAAGEFAHGVEHVTARGRAGRQRVEKHGGGKVRRRALEADVQEFTAVTAGQRSHGAGDLFLLFRPRADDQRLKAFEAPAGLVDRRAPAAPRHPAEIVNVKRERRRKIEISLKDDQLTPLCHLVQEPLQRRLPGAHLHQHPGFLKNTAIQAQRNAEPGGPNPGDAYHLAASGERRLDPAQHFPRFALLLPCGDAIPRDAQRYGRDQGNAQNYHLGIEMPIFGRSDVKKWRAGSRIPFRKLRVLGKNLKAAVDSAVDQDGLAGDVGGAVRGEPDDGVGDFLGLAEALDWSVGGPGVADLLWRAAGGQSANLGQLLEAFSGGEARGDVVDQNAVFAELVGKALHQSDHGGADGVREHQVLHRLLDGDRGDGDDPAPAVALHVRNDRFGQMDGAQQVEVDGFAPLVGRDGEEVLGGRAAGVGDANVDAAEALGYVFDEGLHRSGVGDVERFSVDFGAGAGADAVGGGAKRDRKSVV